MAEGITKAEIIEMGNQLGDLVEFADGKLDALDKDNPNLKRFRSAATDLGIGVARAMTYRPLVDLLTGGDEEVPLNWRYLSLMIARGVRRGEANPYRDFEANFILSSQPEPKLLISINQDFRYIPTPNGVQAEASKDFEKFKSNVAARLAPLNENLEPSYTPETWRFSSRFRSFQARDDRLKYECYGDRLFDPTDFANYPFFLGIFQEAMDHIYTNISKNRDILKTLVQGDSEENIIEGLEMAKAGLDKIFAK